MDSPRVGLVTVDSDGSWMGGRYYLHHLVRAVASLTPQPIELYDVYWEAPPETDPFAEVRSLMQGKRVLAMPRTPTERLRRKARRLVTGNRSASDLFRAAGIDVVYPIPLIENQGTPLVYWLSDLQFRHMPELYPPELLEKMHAETTSRCESASRIVVSSGCAKGDVARFLPQFAGKVDVVRFCSVPDDQWSELDPPSFCARRGLPERFFALSNQFTTHKNQLLVVDALRLLRDRGVHVTVVSTGSLYDFRAEGRRPYYDTVMERVRELGLESQFLPLGLIARSEQIAILRRSVAMLQPSRFEGWSTIVEDAKTLGKTILASDIDVHREQLGPQHRFYGSVDAPEVWADLMMELDASLSAGPNLAEEAAGLQQLAVAKRASGEAFVNAVRNGMK